MNAFEIGNRLDRELGISTTNAGPPQTLDVDVFKAMIENLKGMERQQQEYLITLLATMGFSVSAMQGNKRYMVILPDDYLPALHAVRERQKP